MSVESTLRVVDPITRLDRIIFDPKAEYMDSVIHVGGYRCPHCGTQRQFNTGTLREWEGREDSGFGDAWNSACSKLRPAGPWESVFDFACAGCRALVRIVFGQGREFAMGAYPFHILHVVEMRDPPSDPPTE